MHSFGGVPVTGPGAMQWSDPHGPHGPMGPHGPPGPGYGPTYIPPSQPHY